MASIPPFITSDLIYGLLIGLLLGFLITFAALALPGLSGTDVYSLAHWKLHVQTPLEPLWMNIGYWYFTPSLPFIPTNRFPGTMHP